MDAWLGEARLVQPLSVRIVVAVCLFLIGSFALYGVVGTYTRRVHAEGSLIPDAGLITVATPVAGRVSSSGAEEGDRVEKGQILYTINLDAVSARGPTQERVIEQLERQKASVRRQRMLRATTASTEKKSLADQIRNLESQSTQLDEQIELQKKLVEPLKDRIEVLADALSNGLVRSADFQTQNYIYLQATTQLAQFTQSRLQLDGKLSDLKAQYANFDGKLAQDLAEMDRTIAQLEQQKAESEARRAIEVRAPEEGVLTSIRVKPGQAVEAGAALLTLLPSRGRLQAHLFVDSSSIGFVEPGATVMLRYAAFPYQRFGLHRGVVTEVTRAPLTSNHPPPAPTAENRESEPAPSPDLYRVVVKPDSGTVLAYGEQRPLEAGMRVEADIALENRPLYRWLLDPLNRVKRSFELVTNSG